MEDEGRERGSSDFGTLLRRYRLAAGLSQETLAERARVSLNGISALERGYRRTPQRETVALLAGALALNDEQRQAFEGAAARPRLPRRRGETSVTVGPWPGAESATLPFSLTRFIGRDVDLDEIGALLRTHRLVTITGAGGVGKTQTALRAANGLDDVVESIRFVALASVSDSSLVASAIATALGVQEVPNRPLLETLTAYLKMNASLLILDNCEHLVGAVAVIAAAVLGNCPRVRILATSREPLAAAGERVYRLPSLSENDGVALFADRAQAVDAHFTLTDENAPTVGEICRHLDGIPLAIELAAARANMWSVQELVGKLGDRFKILKGGERTALPRQQTMRAAIDWSYNLLSRSEQRLLERLSVFAGGCTTEAAIAVCASDELAEDDIFDLLSVLVAKSLVLAEPCADVTRYRLLESTRAYAGEKLADTGERDVLAGRHLRYFRDLFGELQDQFKEKPRPADLIAALRTELPDVRLALDGALARSDVIDGAKLLANTSVSWRPIGLESEGTARYEAFLAALPVKESHLRGRLSTELSYLLGVCGERQRAFEMAEQAVEQARASGDDSLVAKALRQYAQRATVLCRF
ncbi:MAG TPA: helix-turn-helix domain-containing protein, partial [Candidatus Cybelea sp.]